MRVMGLKCIIADYCVTQVITVGYFHRVPLHGVMSNGIVDVVLYRIVHSNGIDETFFDGSVPFKLTHGIVRLPYKHGMVVVVA